MITQRVCLFCYGYISRNEYWNSMLGYNGGYNIKFDKKRRFISQKPPILFRHIQLSGHVYPSFISSQYPILHYGKTH